MGKFTSRVLLPVLVGCATALVIAVGFREGPPGSNAARQTATRDAFPQVSAPGSADSPQPDSPIAQAQFLASLIGDADSRFEKGRDFVRRPPRRLNGGPMVGQEEFDAARKLYDEQDYVAAREAFKKLLKKYKKKNLPIEEDALFYFAECNYQLAEYPAAQDGYDELLNEFPSTRYFDYAIRRLYAIGRYWLKSPQPASEVELAAFTAEDGEQQHLREVYDPGESALKLNFTDPAHPFVDTPGRAIQALRSVYVLDSSGPLADDAVMLLALYSLRTRDYAEADEYFSQIRETYHRSEHLIAAYVLGALSRWKSYLESRSDSKQLEEAKKLTASAIRLFPDLPQRPQLERQLKEIEAEVKARANNTPASAPAPRND